MDSDAALAAWRDALRAALGPNGQVLVEILLELEMILGPQPAVVDVPPTEASNRFDLVVHHFLRVFTQPEHPLVISRRLTMGGCSLAQIAPDAKHGNGSYHPVLIGVAYRDNEVGMAHPLRLMLDTMQQAEAHVHYLTVPPLAVPHVAQWLSDALACPPEHVRRWPPWCSRRPCVAIRSSS